MTMPLSPELCWLAATAILTFFLAPISAIKRVSEQGFNDALTSKKAVIEPPKAEWGKRAMRAHANAVDNLVVFATLIIILHLQGASTTTTTNAAMIYFIARIAHAVAYISGATPIRGFSFGVSIVCIIIIAIRVLTSF